MRGVALFSAFALVLAFSHAAGLNEACNALKPCEPASSTICVEKVCKCRDRFFEDETTDECVAALGKECAVAGDACEKIPYALCSEEAESTCECIRGYTPVAGDGAVAEEHIHCSATNIGDHCVEEQQCRLPYSQFDGDRCVCKTGYVPDLKAEKCLPNAVRLGDPCQIAAQCSVVDPNTVCSGNPKVCTCRKDYFVQDAFDKKCLPVARKYGEPCQSLAECTMRLGVDAACSLAERVCECTDKDFVTSIDGSRCLPKMALNEFCVQDQQCSTDSPNSECGADFKCACSKEYEEIQAKCHKIPQVIGDACVETSQCTKHITNENIECRGGMCQCTVGHKPNPAFDKCEPGAFIVGSPCLGDVQCSESIENAFCDTTKVCACKEEFVPSVSNLKCLPRTTGLYGNCEDLGQCVAEIAGEVDCVNKKCNCKANCHFWEERCWNSRRLAEPCIDSRECRLAKFSDRAECAMSRCACKANLTADLITNQCNSGSNFVASFALPAILVVFLQKFAAL